MEMRITWLAAGLFAAAAIFVNGSAAAECPEGKIEVVRITPGQNQKVHTKCVSENAQGGQETAGDNAAGTISFASFTRLGDLEGGVFSSEAADVSADGSVVVGSSRSDGGFEAFRWTKADGMVGLGFLSSAGLSQARGVSADGSVIVGYDYASFTPQVVEAFLWTVDPDTGTGVMVGLGHLLGGTSSTAEDVSADGSVVVGGSNDGSIYGGYQAVRWVDGVIDPLGGSLSAYGVSEDGSVIAGITRTGVGDEAFRWTADTGMVVLDPLTPGSSPLDTFAAWAVSDDGSAIVGLDYIQLLSPSTAEAFRWTADTGTVGLGHLPDGLLFSTANAVSADGSVVVGLNWTAFWNEAFRWTDADGIQSVQSLLEAEGVDLTGWRLYSATGVSGDGTTIVGYGRNPEGNTEAWLATLPRP